MVPSPTRRGRPPAPPGQRKSKNFTFRSRGDLHARLAAAAAQSNRSISEEIEWRIERSFLDQDRAIEALDLTYGRELAGLLLVLGAVMKEVGEQAAYLAEHTLQAARNWMAHPFAFAKAKEAANAVLEAFKPPDEGIHRVYDEYPSVPREIVNCILEEAATGRSRGHSEERARLLHAMLGPLVERIPDFASPQVFEVDVEVRKASTERGAE
jgi:HicB family